MLGAAERFASLEPVDDDEITAALRAILRAHPLTGRIPKILAGRTIGQFSCSVTTQGVLRSKEYSGGLGVGATGTGTCG